MEKEEIDAIAKILSEMKDTIDRLALALRKKDSAELNASKRKIVELQTQIGRKL